MKLLKICQSWPSALVQEMWLTEIGLSEEVEEEVEREEEREWEMEWKWNMEREEGETVVSFQRERGKRGERARTKRKPSFPSHRKKWKLVSWPGRVLLFCCFYSNCFYVLILPICSYYYAMCGKKLNTNARDNMIISNQAEKDIICEHTLLHRPIHMQKQVHTYTSAWDSFKMAWHVACRWKRIYR